MTQTTEQVRTPAPKYIIGRLSKRTSTGRQYAQRKGFTKHPMWAREFPTRAEAEAFMATLPGKGWSVRLWDVR